jgi:peptidoglycan/LPS O-acetylase OafA/YrhL
MSFGGNIGRIGVICFFVLSGFLITYLMFTEQAKKGKLNILFFYIRRVLRIWPLYFITLIIGFVIYPLILKISNQEYHETANWFMYAFFAANFDHIYFGYPTSNILGVQWSVSVEEQFYFIWPVFFTLVNRKKMFPWLLGLIILSSEIFSIWKGSHISGGDYHFLSCIRYLSFGALLAYFCFHKTNWILLFLSKVPRTAIVFIYLICIFIMIMQNRITDLLGSYIYLYHITPVLFFGFIIIEQNFSPNSFFKIGSFKIMSWLGKISYGLYLTHMIAINIVLAIMPKSNNYVLLNILLAIVLCIGISHFSYTYLEKYFLSLKKRFSFTEQQKS